MACITLQGCFNDDVLLFRLLYWTDWSTRSPGIYRSTITNIVRTPVITSDIKYPNALAIDFPGRTVL